MEVFAERLDIFRVLVEKFDCISIQVLKDQADFSISQMGDTDFSVLALDLDTKGSIIAFLSFKIGFSLTTSQAALLRTSTEKEALV